MAVGKSNRIVVELEPSFKEELHAALKLKGLTLKEWIIAQATNDLGCGTKSRKDKKK